MFIYSSTCTRIYTSVQNCICNYMYINYYIHIYIAVSILVVLSIPTFIVLSISTPNYTNTYQFEVALLRVWDHDIVTN